jgi:hypothetical protein
MTKPSILKSWLLNSFQICVALELRFVISNVAWVEFFICMEALRRLADVSDRQARSWIWVCHVQRYEYTHIQTYIHNTTCIKEAQIQFFVLVFVVCSSALNEGNGNLKKIAEFTRTTAGQTIRKKRKKDSQDVSNTIRASNPLCWGFKLFATRVLRPKISCLSTCTCI